MFCGDPNYAGEPNLTWLGTDSASYYNSYVLKSDHGWAELMDFIYILNNNPNEIESVLNVDRVLWAFALNQPSATTTRTMDTTYTTTTCISQKTDCGK